MRSLILMFLCLFIQAEELPRSAQRILDGCAAEIAKAQEACAVAVAKAQASAIKSLEREMANVTRKGNLEEALAIKGAIERLSAEMLGAAPLPGSVVPETGAAVDTKNISVRHYGVFDGVGTRLDPTGCQVTPPSFWMAVDDDDRTYGRMEMGTEYTVSVPNVRARAILICMRFRGGGDDIAHGMRVAVNGTTVEVGDAGQEKAVMVPVPGGVLRSLAFQAKSITNGPGVREIRIVQ